MTDTQKTIAVGLSPNQLAKAFPWHFVLDEKMQIGQFGKALIKLSAAITPTDNFSSHFFIKSPHITPGLSAIIEQSHTVFFIEALASKQTLRGQFLIRDKPEKGAIFIGSPVVRDMESVLSMGLTLDDFAIHDAVIDMLLVLQSKTNTIDDTKRMATQLRKEVNERRAAQLDLQTANEELERRVITRTEQLRISNQKLEQNINHLERHNAEMRILNKMGDKLQACRSLKETYDAISPAMSELFPGSSGMLVLVESESGQFINTSGWGKTSAEQSQFSKVSCRALRLNRIQINNNTQLSRPSESCSCQHLESHVSRYTCIPLSLQNEQIGLMQVMWPHDQENNHENKEETIQLAQTASDHIALAIANVQLQEQLRLQSIRDVLTGLYNRRHMEDTLHRELLHAKRQNTPLGIIMLDVDHFKQFNDTYGHDTGDDLLRQLGTFLTEIVRGDDIAFRFGGEEFTLILPSTTLANTGAIAQKICHDAAEKVTVNPEGNQLLHITISTGVAAYPEFGDRPEQLIQAADKALYQAKRSGRNRSVIATLDLIEQSI